MKTLYTHQSENVKKTWLLMTGFLVVVIGIGFLFSQIYHNTTILYGFIIFSIIMNFVSYWYADKIALSSAHAEPADPKEFQELHRIVENLSITAGLPKPRVYVINDPAPNAFATGRNKEHAAIAFTTGLLQILDKSELEILKQKRKDIIKNEIDNIEAEQIQKIRDSLSVLSNNQ